MKPIVAIVGRPNVGKSTFFNRLAGGKVSIVEDMPGVTRDRVYADTDWNGKPFTVIDTGGLEIKSDDQMFMHIKKQAEIAVDMADVIIFFCDGRQGLIEADRDVAAYLRKSKKKIVLAVNKVDNYKIDVIFEFYELGLGEPFPISSELGQGLGDLLDEVVEDFERDLSDPNEVKALKIAVVGKPNAGKSSLVNRLLGYERTIVSNVAGTTRDAIDTNFSLNGKDYTLIDTAGIRRKSKVEEDVEYYSVLRALGSIKKADVCLVMIDSTYGEVSEQDVKIAAFCHNEGKPTVICMNKWDAVEKDSYTILGYKRKLDDALAFMSYYQSIFISAKTGLRVEKLIDMVEYVHERTSFRPKTGVLNEILADATRKNPPPSTNGKRLKILYGSCVSTCPPTFVLFCNDETLMKNDYKHYLENQFRAAFNFDGTPIKIVIRSKSEDD